MNRRSPSVALAAAMRPARSSGDAAVYRSASGVWSRSMCWEPPSGGSGYGRWGQPGRLSHGDVVPGTDMQPECRAGLPAVYEVRPRMTESLPNNDAPCARGHVRLELPREP